jgi:hypothetical protein
MHRRTEAFPNKPRQFRRPNGRFFLSHLRKEGHDFLGEFVRPLGTKLPWYQADQAVLLENRQRLMEGRSRKTETRRRSCYRLAIGLYPAQHLVFDLDQVARIEESVLDKQLVSDILGGGFKVPCGWSVRSLASLSAIDASKILWNICKYNYAPF